MPRKYCSVFSATTTELTALEFLCIALHNCIKLTIIYKSKVEIGIVRYSKKKSIPNAHETSEKKNCLCFRSFNANSIAAAIRPLKIRRKRLLQINFASSGVVSA